MRKREKDAKTSIEHLKTVLTYFHHSTCYISCLQVETLVNENTKLNSKLSETSNFLQDVKSSKEMLENDLSSVFQLYNMRSQAKANHDRNQDIKDGISDLVEENAKLKVELKDTQEEKRDLQMQLKNAKVCYFVHDLL